MSLLKGGVAGLISIIIIIAIIVITSMYVSDVDTVMEFIKDTLSTFWGHITSAFDMIKDIFKGVFTHY